MSCEIWKNIKGYPDYQISNFGRVKSFKGSTPIILKPNRGIYLSVMLNSYKRLYIHRLVANEFVENIHSKPQVNHKDGNKNNNSFNNLEWCTPKENTQHAYINGLIRSRGGKRVFKLSF